MKPRQQTGATHLQEIRHEVALQVRLAPLADLVSLQQVGDAVAAETRDGPPAEAARVHDVVPDEIAVLVQPVMRLAEGDAGAAAGDEAGIDGIEAAEEGRVPGCGSGGVGDAGMILGDVVDPVHPVVDVVLHLGFFVGGGGHCCWDSGEGGEIALWGKMRRNNGEEKAG